MNALEQNLMWQDACAVALVELPGLTPVRLNTLLSDRPPDVAWEALGAGAPLASLESTMTKDELLTKWRTVAKRRDPLEVLERYSKLDVGVWHRYGSYPKRLRNDDHAPAVLFVQGDAAALSAPTVGVIGTRHCSAEGRALARTFGEELADAGVSVVSGLALGVDGAAHAGALQAAFGGPPVGVVGSGLDVPYPRRHSHLWADLQKRGLLISESQLGATPEPWRFPARNRIIAGLADVLLVVESHERGGSLLTVNEAADRGVPVMAVPGSIRSPSCKGSNKLLADGATPACSTQDVLDVLMAEVPARRGQIGRPEVGRRGAESPSVLEIAPADQPILEAVGFNSTSMDEILLRTCLPLGEVAVALARLQSMGFITGDDGWWFRTQRSGAPE